ncbi:hypothetical protein [Chromohalobacter moromii]|uniref:Uncharacterized protein n=1 Tax=Chromohalobacter moromii TaxID=2860329 RepID=A0A9X2WZD6_9GAMM|nr:hypothetical protein [Chromohalobacter moromii]MCK2044830.1 hypothetical protein [Chromohalobacter moromii]MCT8504017.1 hypothetical protein [Chromohalobacter moromii]
MDVERLIKDAKDHMTVLFFLVIGLACWYGFMFSIGPASLFEVISKKSTVLVGLVSAPAVVASLTLRKAESRSHMAVAMTFFSVALLALFLIIMSPLENMMPENGELASIWFSVLSIMFILGIFIMVGALIETLKAHMLEGER